MEDDEEEEEAFMEEDDEEGGGSDTDGEGAKEKSLTDQKLIEERTAMLIAYFFFSMVWSVGATLDANSRAKFDEFFKGLCDMDGTTAKYPRLLSLMVYSVINENFDVQKKLFSVWFLIIG